MEHLAKPEDLLNGHKVLEWVSAGEPDLVHIAVGFAGRLLSDLGAEVSRVTLDDDPILRIMSAFNESVSSSSVLATYLNRNKAAIEPADVEGLIEREERPHLVLYGAIDLPQPCQDIAGVSASAFHPASNLNGVAVSELGIQGLVGLTDLFGEPGKQPLMMGGHQTAYAMGYAVFCAAMANLTKLRILDQIDTARVNAVDALAWVNWKGVAAGALKFPVVRGGKGAEAPVLRCADGFFAFLHLPNNWADICAEVNDPRLLDEQFSSPGRRAKNALSLNQLLAEWAADKTWASLYEFCQRCAIPGGPVLRGAELLEDPLYQHRNFLESTPHMTEEGSKNVQVPGLPLTVEAVAERNPQSTACTVRYSENTPTALPLSGKLVLDLGIFTAGSVTSTLLADLGACVIKVESESYSDPFRIWPGIKGDSPLFTFNNRNKLGLNLDLKTSEGRALFLELVAQADVVVENFRRGVLARLGIDFPALKAANPKIVLASISGQGASGPGSGHVSFGSTLEAIGGVAALTGYPDGGCYISGRNLNYPDQIVCLYGAGAVMAAMLEVNETGRGMHIDVSQREVTTLAVGETLAAASLFGSAGKFPGNADLNAFLQDIYPTRDGWLCVTVATEAEGRELGALLACGPGEVEPKLARWLSSEDSVDAIAKLRGIGVAAFKANSGAEAAKEPAIQSGTAFAKTGSGQMVKGFPFQFEDTPLGIYEESPGMGEHTENILRTCEASK